MDKRALIERILALPVDIGDAEKLVMTTSQAVHVAEEQVADMERDAILSGAITGKNEAERKAQLATLTARARQVVVEKEIAQNMARVNYNQLTNEFRALRTVAGLLNEE